MIGLLMSTPMRYSYSYSYSYSYAYQHSYAYSFISICMYLAHVYSNEILIFIFIFIFTAQGWNNRTPISHERVDSRFLVLPGSESTITQITE